MEGRDWKGIGTDLENYDPEAEAFEEEFEDIVKVTKTKAQAAPEPVEEEKKELQLSGLQRVELARAIGEIKGDDEMEARAQLREIDQKLEEYKESPYKIEEATSRDKKRLVRLREKAGN